MAGNPVRPLTVALWHRPVPLPGRGAEEGGGAVQLVAEVAGEQGKVAETVGRPRKRFDVNLFETFDLAKKKTYILLACLWLL